MRPVKYATQSDEAVRRMPFTGMSREECRLVSCPVCSAEPTYWCTWPNTTDPSTRRRKSRIHKRRIEKAAEYRSEGRI